MLSWFGPRCPLDTNEKMWTEFRMRWLAGKLGLDRLVNAEVILPEPQFFPDAYTPTPAGARRIFDRVCTYMNLDPDRFRFKIRSDESITVHGAAGLYYEGEQPRIVLANSQLADPERLVATIAHELAHDILLGGKLITTDEPDHEHVTDLLPVFLGLGLFAANAPVRDLSYTQNGRHYFQIGKQGYLPSRMLGYALALFAYARGEANPAWSRYLRPDAAEPLKHGLRYVRKTGDSLFGPDTERQPVNPPTVAEAIDRLSAGSATVRALTLWQLSNMKTPPVELVDAVVRGLSDRDTDIRIGSARALQNFGAAAHIAVPELAGCLGSRSDTLRAYAATALSLCGGPADEIVPELTRLLEDSDLAVVDAAAEGLHRLAAFAASAVPAVMEALRKSAIACEPSDNLAAALVAINPPADILQELLDPVDVEIRKAMNKALQGARLRPESARSGTTAADHR